VLTQEHKDRIAAANTGKRHTNETREKLRQINLGKTILPEVRIKIGNASRRKPRPQWVRDKISAGSLGKVLTPEHRLHISEAHKGRKQSPEAIAKRAAAICALGGQWTKRKRLSRSDCRYYT
jgi:hypothetical protein